MTTKHQVISTHLAHPDWTTSDIAKHLGCIPQYVTATARRNGLRLPKGRSNFAYLRLSGSTIEALTEPAIKRGLSPRELAVSIVETVAREKMIDAVLDDGVAA